MGVIAYCDCKHITYVMERSYEEFQVAMQSLKRKITYPWKFIIKTIRGKEFLAEFLGTFLLVVSQCNVYIYIISDSNMW